MKKIDKILKELIKYTKSNEIAQLEILFEKPYQTHDECKKDCEKLTKKYGSIVEFTPYLCDCFSDNPNMKISAVIYGKEIRNEENR